jgi:hypothetical protein
VAKHLCSSFEKSSIMAGTKNNKWKWTLGTLAVLVVGGFLGWHFLKKDLSKPNSAVEKSLSKQFAEMITEASDSLYKVSYSRFDLSLDSGKGVISDFRLVPDSAVLERLIKANRAPNNVLTMQVKNLVLSDFGFKKTDKGNRFTMNRIVIEHPSITIVNVLRPYNVSARAEKHGKLFSLMQKMLKISNINSISMRNMDFSYVNDNSSPGKKTTLRNLNIDMGGISALEVGSQGRKSTEIVVNRYRIATPDSLYYLTANALRFVPELRKASIGRAELTPRLTKKAFYQHVKWAKDRIHLQYQNIQMSNIDVDRFLRTQQLHIGTYAVDYSFAEVYTNYNWPRRTPPVRRNPYPHQQLQRIAFDITIDTMRMKNADTYYRVLADKSEKVSSLDINNSKGLILNITNNKAAIQKNPYMTASLHSMLMGTGAMQLDMKFNLADPKGSFSYTSTLGPMNATSFNSFSEPFSMMSVKEGRINKMYMTVKADEFKARGKVNLYYTGMKVALLKKDDETKELKDRKVISALSNVFLPNDNPTKNGKFKDGPINVLRPSNMSFFGFMSKCMIDGMSSSMTGLEQKKNKPESNIITEIGETIIGSPGKKVDKKK